jgi:hypothetical protein
MPSIEQNLAVFERPNVWSDRGDNWSRPWGGTRAEWFGTILPRIQGFLPVPRVLEIAPGLGRWTQFLLDYCETLIGIDVAASSIEGCRARFAQAPQATFYQNDGRSLPHIDDGSVDFAFSFDSLVHAEIDVLGDYVAALSAKLSADGVAFLHHSNVGAYRSALPWTARFRRWETRLPRGLSLKLRDLGAFDRPHWRARSVTAQSFANLCESSGLRCVRQELVTWGTLRLLIDCFSVVIRPGSRWDGPQRVLRNVGFMREVWSINSVSDLYGFNRPS